jgi:hypothetical protein
LDRLANDIVRLTVPANDQYARVAAAATAGLGVRSGLPPADVDDLATAVGDAVAKIAVDATDSSQVVLTFTIEPDGLSIAIAGDGPPALLRRKS